MTKPDTLENLIAEHPFWKGLNPLYLHLLYETASYVRFGMNQEVFNEGQPADRFFLIRKGQVSLEAFIPGKGMVCVQTLGPGDALGWSWLFAPHQWHFTARATEPAEMIAFNAAGLRARAQENRDFGNDLVLRVAQVLLNRLQAARQKLAEFYSGLE